MTAHPETGQTGLLVSFLAGLYNGYDYPFDLSDMRPLDTKLANACRKRGQCLILGRMLTLGLICAFNDPT